MSSNTEDKINCSTHGICNYALVCQHLAKQNEDEIPMKYYVANSQDDDSRSSVENVWCEACDSILKKEGDWTDAAVEFAYPQVICSECLQSIMNRNTKGA